MFAIILNPFQHIHYPNPPNALSSELVAALGIVFLIILILLRMWIAAAMAIVGFVGFAILMGFKPALGVLAQIPFSTVNYYPLTTIPRA